MERNLNCTFLLFRKCVTGYQALNFKNQVNQFEYHFEMIYTEYTAVTLNHCNFNKLFRKLSLNNYN